MTRFRQGSEPLFGGKMPRAAGATDVVDQAATLLFEKIE
jgi:hypothetical protein